MDLEQLNKTQIILLTLLVSFVTSIATGIVTVSLVNQAPPGITQTVSRIVERTVEKVVPDVSGHANQGAAVITTTEKTVIVKEEDLASQAIEKAQKSVILIVPKGVEGATPVARGVIVDAKGIAVTDRAALEGGIAYEAVTQSGERLSVSLRTPQEGNTVAILDLTLSTSTKLTPVVFGSDTALKLGQSVIRLGGRMRDSAALGAVASLPTKDGQGTGAFIETDISSTMPGSLLLTLYGEVVGFSSNASIAAGPEFYAMGSVIKDTLAAN